MFVALLSFCIWGGKKREKRHQAQIQNNFSRYGSDMSCTLAPLQEKKKLPFRCRSWERGAGRPTNLMRFHKQPVRGKKVRELCRTSVIGLSPCNILRCPPSLQRQDSWFMIIKPQTPHLYSLLDMMGISLSFPSQQKIGQMTYDLTVSVHSEYPYRANESAPHLDSLRNFYISSTSSTTLG